MKTLIRVLCFLVLITNFNVVSADENDYLVQNGGETVESFARYSQANAFFNSHKNEYDNLCITRNDSIIRCEYGVVELPKGAVRYRDEQGREYTVNGNYLADVPYLDSDEKNITFIMAGKTVSASRDNLNIRLIEDVSDSLSVYEVHDGILYHKIKTSLSSKYYAYIINLAEKPEELSEGRYYSSDGHYFYDDYRVMIDDYKTHENAVNRNAYYNYFMYLPFRSLSNYGFEELNAYFTDTLGINAKLDRYDDFNDDAANDTVNRSQLYREINAFKASEEVFGTNALLLLAMSAYESSYGKSLSSFTDNNLFTNAAFSSQYERQNQRYEKLSDSVYAYSRYYLNDRYFSSFRSSYAGYHLGDKASGIATRYSDDPFYGEKVASIAFKLDYLGKDLNDRCLAVINSDRLIIYASPQLSGNVIILNSMNDYVLTVLEEYENSYKVIYDRLSNDESYDWKENTAYIRKEDVSILINPDKIREDELVTVTFDFDGGILEDRHEIKSMVKKGAVPGMDSPEKKGYEFTGYDRDFEAAETSSTYKATWRKIDSIEVEGKIKYLIELNTYPDLRGARLLVRYEDGKVNRLPLDSEMIKNFQSHTDGEYELEIEYCGMTVTVPVKVTSGTRLLRNDVMGRIADNIASFKKNGSFSAQDLIYIREKMEDLELKLDFNDIRYLDLIYLNYHDGYPKYIIKDNDNGISISGLGLSLKGRMNRRPLQLYDDTYIIHINDVEASRKKILEDFVSGYDFRIEKYLNLNINLNVIKTESEGPMVIQAALENSEGNRSYSVYHLDKNGDIIKCKTTWSNTYVQFIARECGDYVILSSYNGNHFDISDSEENITVRENAENTLGIEMMILMTTAFIIYGFICAVMYFILERNNRQWNVSRKLLARADTVQEEEPKS